MLLTRRSPSVQLVGHPSKRGELCLGIFHSRLAFMAAIFAATSSVFQEKSHAQNENPQKSSTQVSLIATTSDGKNETTSLTANIGYRLLARQSPHPLIDDVRWNTIWKGQLQVEQPGSYRFFGEALGNFSLALGGNTVLEFDSANAQTAQKFISRAIELEYGLVELSAQFSKREAMPAILHLEWESPDGFRGPIPTSALRHNDVGAHTELERSQQLELGRDLIARHRCLNCHRADSALSEKFGIQPGPSPRLDDMTKRHFANWIYHWLENPRGIRPNSSMPDFFDDSPESRLDRRAVASFLTQGDIRQPRPRAVPTPQEGENQFASLGCVACHLSLGETAEDNTSLHRIDGMGSKLSRTDLLDYLQHPDQFHTGIGGADFQLAKNPDQLQTLADYLSSSRDAEMERSMPEFPADRIRLRFHEFVNNKSLRMRFDRLGEQERLKELGRIVVSDRGCLSCHQLGELKSTQPPVPTFAEVCKVIDSQTPNSGCLGDRPHRRIPNFGFNDDQRRAIGQYLSHGITDVGSDAPGYLAEITLDRLGCTACHLRNGRGGRFARRISPFIELTNDQTLLDLSPPDLSSIGEKLRPEWLQRVIVKGDRARSWMSLRMPVYPQEVVNNLPQQILVADAEEQPQQQLSVLSATNEELEAAKLLVGATGMNCVGCHDVLGHKSLGVRGPDLATLYSRLKQSWFERWMHNPQLLTPGTRMPAFFNAGNSAAPQFLGGEERTQVAALWKYFSREDKLGLPILTPPGRGSGPDGETNTPIPLDRPLIVHGFMVGHAGLRGIALGYPAKTHFAFDSETCQLTRVWTGDFIEQGGWFGSGQGSALDNGLKIRGEVIWRGPEHPLISLNRENETLDATDQLPKVRFDASWASKKTSGFAYGVFAPENERIHVEETPAPLEIAGLTGFVREICVTELPKEHTLLVCLQKLERSDQSFELVNPSGDLTPFPTQLEQSSARVISDQPGLIVRDSFGPLLLWITHAPPAAKWVIHEGKDSDTNVVTFAGLDFPSDNGKPVTFRIIYVRMSGEDLTNNSGLQATIDRLIRSRED